MKNLFAIAAVLGLAVTGCVKDDGVNPKADGNQFFDFATTQTGNISVRYDLAGYDSGILFEVYAENPVDAATGGRKEGVKALFKANTDGRGVFSGRINLPSCLTSVYLMTDAYVTRNLVEVPVIAGAISFDAASRSSATSVASRTLAQGANHSYPDIYRFIDDRDDWSQLGRPSNINQPTGAPKTIPSGLLNDIFATLPIGHNLEQDPARNYLVDPDCSHDIHVKDSCQMDMVYLGDGATYNNVVGYFIYREGQRPSTPGEIANATVAFPNAKIDNWNGCLFPGDYIRLKYRDEASGRWSDTIPAGYCVGFFLHQCAFDGPNTYDWGHKNTANIYDINAVVNPIYYSNAHLNYTDYPGMADNNRQHTVALYNYNTGDTNRDVVVIGFEDMSRWNGWCDYDYNDVLFYVQTTPATAITIPGGHDDNDLDPDPDPTPKGYEIEYEGTLAFEDLWPFRGDYDMNDLGIKYHSVVYYNAQNQIYKTIDTFTPACKGGRHSNGFGFQYGVTPGQVTGCAINPSAGAPVASYPTFPGMAIEAGQSKAVVMLFNDIKPLLTGHSSDIDKSGQLPLHTYTVVTEFNNVTAAELGFPPYNPFIIVQPAGTDEDQRAREVHLTNYRPTDLCTDPADVWFGKGHDKSNKADLWYVSSERFPFAINIPSMSFSFPDEYQRIDLAYPRFANWVSTRGAQDADWWK